MSGAAMGRKQWLVTGAVAILVFAAFVLSPLDSIVQASLRRALDVVIWDYWHGGKVNWGDREISLPAGRVKWTQATTGTLTLVSRDASRQVMVSLSRVSPAPVDVRRLVADLCGKSRCDGIEESSMQIGTMPAVAIDYHDRDLGSSYHSYLSVDRLGILVHVSGESSAARDDGKQLAIEVLRQLQT